MGLVVFPPTGLEYVASALKGHVDRVTLVDLRLPGPMRNLATLTKFIADEIDLLCISINWEYHFTEVCDLVNSLPREVFIGVGGKQGTDYVEEVLEVCPGVNIVVRGEGEEAVTETARGLAPANIKGISYRNRSVVIHNLKRPLQQVDSDSFPDRSLRQQ